MSRRILTDVTGLAISEIEAELAQVRAEKVRLEMEEQLLAQILRLRQWATDGVPGATDTVAAIGATASDAKRANITASVLTIVREADGQFLSPATVVERVASLGIVTEPTNVRMALRRWAERGEIVKEGKGRGTRYAAANRIEPAAATALASADDDYPRPVDDQGSSPGHSDPLPGELAVKLAGLRPLGQADNP